LIQDELSAWLWLYLTPGFGDSSASKLLAEFGLPGEIFNQSVRALGRVVNPAQSKALQQIPDELAALEQKTWDWLAAQPSTRHLLPMGDPGYPQALLSIEDPTVMLYEVGIEEAWGPKGLNHIQHVCLVVVGSSNPTPQGLVNEHDFPPLWRKAGSRLSPGSPWASTVRRTKAPWMGLL
jgi:DNA processing protein